MNKSCYFFSLFLLLSLPLRAMEDLAKTVDVKNLFAQEQVDPESVLFASVIKGNQSDTKEEPKVQIDELKELEEIHQKELQKRQDLALKHTEVKSKLLEEEKIIAEKTEHINGLNATLEKIIRDEDTDFRKLRERKAELQKEEEETIKHYLGRKSDMSGEIETKRNSLDLKKAAFLAQQENLKAFEEQASKMGLNLSNDAIIQQNSTAAEQAVASAYTEEQSTRSTTEEKSPAKQPRSFGSKLLKWGTLGLVNRR